MALLQNYNVLQAKLFQKMNLTAKALYSPPTRIGNRQSLFLSFSCGTLIPLRRLGKWWSSRRLITAYQQAISYKCCANKLIWHTRAPPALKIKGCEANG
jgi:hypothetical protein